MSYLDFTSTSRNVLKYHYLEGLDPSTSRLSKRDDVIEDKERFTENLKRLLERYTKNCCDGGISIKQSLKTIILKYVDVCLVLIRYCGMCRSVV